MWSHPIKLSQTAQRGADAGVYRGVWELIGQLTGERKLTLYCVRLIIRLHRHTQKSTSLLFLLCRQLECVVNVLGNFICALSLSFFLHTTVSRT